MSRYFIKTPNLIQFLFKNLIWSFSNSNKNEKTIYLTFDDGPTPHITKWVLNTLEEYNAKATFFCIGKNIKNHPNIYQQIVSKGHSIGNHTNNHLNGWKTSTQKYIENIDLAEKLIDNNLPKLFRPPYGKIKPNQARKIRNKGYKIIMWEVLSADFDTTISNEKCLENVIKNTKNGSIIVFHDSVKAGNKMKYALPKVLSHFNDNGYQFKKIP
ncbi:polysaccharide deacetylase family protein [Urechidicola croceus]|uniref:Polysaccharide deacetylase family protein n=1 Tax=Urechidicola croceus TaxID=1850246 RepID=A0A1D8PA76_9FLAO|nr:polysaccharide deacetylase family protein [Urechidicola croceus]AOW21480.1 polysaccharide deacetylase family protein [Urechidicola croceus]